MNCVWDWQLSVRLLADRDEVVLGSFLHRVAQDRLSFPSILLGRKPIQIFGRRCKVIAANRTVLIEHLSANERFLVIASILLEKIGTLIPAHRSLGVFADRIDQFFILCVVIGDCFICILICIDLMGP